MTFPIIMKKEDSIATIYETEIVIVNSITGVKSVERVRRHLKTLNQCINGHIRCLKLRGFE